MTNPAPLCMRSTTPQLWTDYYLPLLVFKGCDGTHSLLVNPNTKVGKIYLQPTDGR